MGWKGSLPGDIASQLAALKGPLSSDITSQLALLQNLQSLVEDPETVDKRSSTPDTLGVRALNYLNIGKCCRVGKFHYLSLTDIGR